LAVTQGCTLLLLVAPFQGLFWAVFGCDPGLHPAFDCALSGLAFVRFLVVMQGCTLLLLIAPFQGLFWAVFGCNAGLHPAFVNCALSGLFMAARLA